MLHLGASRRSKEVDLARQGSIMLHFGTSRPSMEVDLACPGLILVHFGTSRRSEKHKSVAQEFILDALAPQDALGNQHR